MSERDRVLDELDERWAGPEDFADGPVILDEDEWFALDEGTCAPTNDDTPTIPLVKLRGR